MRNLYIVNTPLHLFTAYILANYYTVGQENILALVNPKGFSLWKNSRCLTQMYTDKSTWMETIVGSKDYLRAHVKKYGIWGSLSNLKTEIDAVKPIDQVYLASDKVIGNQILVEMSGNTTFIRFDEGTSSYIYPPARQRKSKIAEYTIVQLVRLLTGLHLDMRYNYNGIGCSKAATADYLFRADMLKRPSPNAIQISQKAIQNALDKVVSSMNSYEELRTGNIILYLGSRTTDREEWMKIELELLRKLVDIAGTINYQLVYKPHHGERREKLAYYREQIPAMNFFDSFEPMEIVLYQHENIKFLVTAVHTSAMLYASLFAGRPIVSVSAAWLMGWGPGPIALLLQDAGMKIPESLEELRQIFID